MRFSGHGATRRHRTPKIRQKIGGEATSGSTGRRVTMSGPPCRRIEPNDAVDEVARRVIGAAIEVHRVLGPGFAEAAYEQALTIELRLLGIAFERQVCIDVVYKDHRIDEGRIDLIVEGCLVVELKAVETLLPVHVAQVVSY